MHRTVLGAASASTPGAGMRSGGPALRRPALLPRLGPRSATVGSQVLASQRSSLELLGAKAGDNAGEEEEMCALNDDPFHWREALKPEDGCVFCGVPPQAAKELLIPKDQGAAAFAASQAQSQQAPPLPPSSQPQPHESARQQQPGARGASSPTLQQLQQLQQLQRQQLLRQQQAQQPVAVLLPDIGSAEETTEQCTVLHPGSLACSAATVHRDRGGRWCRVSMTTTVSLTEPGACFDADELERLGWSALEHASADRLAQRAARELSQAQGHERRVRIERILMHGAIVHAEKMTNQFGHVSYLLTLEDHETQERIRAFFKPHVDNDPWHRASIEVVAFRLSLLLGMPYVPPSVYRPAADVDWTHYEQGGAFIYWCENGRELPSCPSAQAWHVEPQLLLSDTRILDVLLQNSDRHSGHYMLGEHWSRGTVVPAVPPSVQPQRGSGGDPGGHRSRVPTTPPVAPHSGRPASPSWRGRMAPVLIDHAAGFRPEAVVTLDQENSYMTGPTNKISAPTYLRLRFLDEHTLTETMHDLLTPEEVHGLFRRGQDILSFFDGQVAARGYSKVVMEGVCHA